MGINRMALVNRYKRYTRYKRYNCNGRNEALQRYSVTHPFRGVTRVTVTLPARNTPTS